MQQMICPSEEAIYKLVSQVGLTLGVSVERALIASGDTPLEIDRNDPLCWLRASVSRAGIHFREIVFDNMRDAVSFLGEGYPIIVCGANGNLVFVDAGTNKRFEITEYQDTRSSRQMFTRQQLRQLLLQQTETRIFVAKEELECKPMSAASLSVGHREHQEGHHTPPLRRFLGLLSLERRDILIVTLFALVAGILTLATPLAVESLVNVVGWGIYLQPLLVLGMVLFISLGLAGVLKVLQTVAVEMIQRRQFVRIAGDLAHRFPRANQASLVGEYPRELANRIFDIMTIQKATAVLLLDGVSIVLTTLLGMLLLAFYHPFLLGFDIVLLISMISMTLILGRDGVRSAINESIAKYKVVHWLQDVLASPTAFKIGGGESLAIDRANELTSEYLKARSRQFWVVLRQATFAIALQVVASTVVLSLGGWLVIQGQLTLGQLVASELIVTLVVGAFAKAGKSLEKFYDLMAGVDKVGHLIDIAVDDRPDLISIPNGPVSVQWTDLSFRRPSSTSVLPATQVAAGATVAVVGDDVDGMSDLARAIAGLRRPSEGVVRINDLDPVIIAGGPSDRVVGYAGEKEIFCGTLRENIDLGRVGIGQARVRAAINAVGLSEVVLRLPSGLQTPLQTGGYPLTEEQIARLTLARAMVAQPNLLIINRVLDEITPQSLACVWKTLTADDAPWTLLIVTNQPEIAARCQHKIAVRRVEHTVTQGAQA